MVLVDAVSNRDVCMDFEPCFKVYNLFTLKASNLHGQMTTLNAIFHVVVLVYRLVEI